MKKVLTAIYLRFDSSSRSLTKRALADLILKTLYFLNGSLSREEVVKGLNEILTAKISDEKIDAAFELLLYEKKIFKSNEGFVIVPDKRSKIDDACNEFIRLEDRVIDKFFSSAASAKDHVLKWFADVTMEFFKGYSAEWISDLCVTTCGALRNQRQGIRVILDKITDNNKELAEKDKEWLKKQFFNFIESSDPDVASILWAYGTSCFQSSLINANTSVDPVSIEEFRDSKCILDTNILMYLDTEEEGREDSFKSMENIFIDLNITPVYFFITRNEYIASVENKKNIILFIVGKYSKEVWSMTDSPYIRTALQRECSTPEDFKLYFEQIKDIPQHLYELLEIRQYDFEGLDEAIMEGQKNNELKSQINDAYKKLRHKDKGKNKVLHDAGLIAGAEFLRKEEKCFILSRDASVKTVALARMIRNEMPVALGLDTLINVLAIDNGGTNIDPTNYAPLFASIIRLALIPDRDVFKVEDLSRMLDIQSQIADLPDDKIIDIARELHHSQVIGMPDDEISLQLSRSFQAAKLSLKSDLEESRKEVYFEKTEKEKFIKRSDKASQKLREQYTGELRDKYDKTLFKNRCMFFGVLPAITIIITAILINTKGDPESSISNLAVGVLANIVCWFLINVLFIDKRIKSKYSERINGINDEVERKIREALEET